MKCELASTDMGTELRCFGKSSKCSKLLYHLSSHEMGFHVVQASPKQDVVEADLEPLILQPPTEIVVGMDHHAWIELPTKMCPQSEKHSFGFLPLASLSVSFLLHLSPFSLHEFTEILLCVKPSTEFMQLEICHVEGLEI